MYPIKPSFFSRLYGIFGLIKPARLMINYFISPHPSLQPFVDNYILCTSENEVISFNGHWPATNETSLVFYMADQPESHINENKNSVLANKNNCIIGLLTRYNGIIHFKGRYHTFLIQFRANGFTKIFNMAMAEFTDKIYSTDDVFGKQTKTLHEQLLNAKNIQSMALLADVFLLSFLERRKKTDTLIDGITFISRELYNARQPLTVTQYAYKANMSVRNFERRFTEQAGVSPKLYSKLARFTQAVNIKIMQPAKNRTSIAYECSYFDQMHFIKDFRQFANFSPSQFMKKNAELNISQVQGKFIFVQRTSI